MAKWLNGFSERVQEPFSNLAIQQFSHSTIRPTKSKCPNPKNFFSVFLVGYCSHLPGRHFHSFHSYSSASFLFFGSMTFAVNRKNLHEVFLVTVISLCLSGILELRGG